MKICHLSTVHPRYDIRIFHKECSSLAQNFDTHLIIADGKGDEIKHNCHIHDLDKVNGRLKRFILSSWRCYKKAVSVNAKLYHFHDPELLFVGLALKLKGKKVVFDSHELTGRQIRTKFYIPKLLRNTTASLFEFIEKQICKKLDAVVVPQEYLMVDHFKPYCANVCVIANYVDINEHPSFDTSKVLEQTKPIKLLYSGTISYDRGLGNMLNLLEELDENYSLVLAGGFTNPAELDKAKQHKAWSRVDYRGFVDRPTLHQIYRETDFGLILFNPVGQYVDATSPLKLFEYMLFGLIVISPDFGSWPKFQKEYNVTFSHEVSDATGIAQTIKNLSEDTLQYQEITSKARELVETTYSWQAETEKLIALYHSILENNNE